MIIRNIAMLGGTGFIGCTLANRLSQAGYAVRVLTRDRESHREKLILLPGLELVETNVHVPSQLATAIAGCDAVINLVGILNEHGRDGSGFRAVHTQLAEKVLTACRVNGVRRLLHMSALHADAQTGPSHYLRSKGAAEDAVHAAKDLHVTSFRPSVVFGPDDDLFNRFAKLLRRIPLLFPLACAQSRFAPVFVGDVADAFVRTLNDPSSYGRRYELCGPDVYTLQQLVAYTADCLGLRRTIIPLSNFLSRVQGAVCDFVPGKPFSTDNYLSTRVDSVCACNDLPALGIQPTPLECVVPHYLSHRTQRARYQYFRSQTGRNADA